MIEQKKLTLEKEHLPMRNLQRKYRSPGCDYIKDQLPALVEAEYLGQNVDADPDYSLYLSHLDVCPECAAVYEILVEGWAMLMDEPDPLWANLRPDSPKFFGKEGLLKQTGS